MGEGTSQIEKEASPDQLVHEIEEIRSNLSGIVSELERRGQELVNWRLQLRRKGPALGVGAGVLAVVAGGIFGIAFYLRRRRQRPYYRYLRMRRALSRIWENPEWVAKKSPSIGKKALSAVASGASGAITKVALQRALAPLSRS